MDTSWWAEYDAVAAWSARRGFKGWPGDSLPPFTSLRVCQEIDNDPEAFARRVREMAYGIAMSKHNFPEL